MDKNILNLVSNIERSQYAYDLYKTNPNYHHALHIFYANKKIYSELNVLLEKELSQNLKNEVFLYLFHLEDWFLQFTNMKNSIIDLESDFVFESFQNKIPYPFNFINRLKEFLK